MSALPDGQARFDNPSTRFDRQLAPQLINAAVQGSGDPTIGLKIGVDFRPETLLDLGYAFPFCQNLREVITLNAQYQPLIQTIGRTRLTMRGDSAWLDWYPNYSDTEFHRYFVEMIFAGYATIGRWLLWGDENPVLSMHFRHSPPEDSTLHHQIFCENVHFGAQSDSIEFSPQTIDVPMPNRNPNMIALLRRRLDIQLSQLNTPLSPATEALRCIQAALINGRPNIGRIATIMGMSERTLRRKLEHEGQSFRGLLEQARRENCEAYLRSERFSQTDIAQMLGFNDHSAYSRAFKGWYGVTPSAYRAGLSQRA